MSKQNLIRQNPKKANLQIDLEKAEQLIAEAPLATADKVIEEKNKAGRKPSEEVLQPYTLRFPVELHKRTKLATYALGYKDMRGWILEAIKEKLEKEGY